jgi:zinc protease
LPIGKKAVLDTFHYQTLKRFYRDWYRPELMAVVAVGSFDPEEIKNQIISNFSDLPVKEQQRKRTYYPVTEHEETLFAIASDPEAQFSGVSIYHKLPKQEENTVSDYKRGLVEQLYNRMFRQRLDELTQQVDPPFLFATSAKGQFVRTGEIYMLNSAVKDNGIPTGFETLLREAKRVEQYGFTESELERQKTRMLVSMERIYNERDKTESDSYADEYTRNYLQGEPIPGIETEFDLYQKLIPEITLAEVNSLAKAWNAPSNRVVMVNSPEKEGVTIPDEDQLKTVMKEVSAEPIEPYQDEIITEKLIDPLPKPAPVIEENYIADIGVTEWKLYNGVRVILKPTDFKNDQVILQAYSPGGYSLAPDSELTAAKTADAIINQGGLGQFNQIQLRKLLADKNVSVSPYIDELYEGFSGRAVPKDLETMFQLIYLYFRQPRTDSTAYLALLDRFEGIFQNRDASPESAYRDTITATLTQHNSRYKPWSLEMIGEMDLQKSSRFYRNRFADAGDFFFILVGNFELPRVRELVETYLASLPGGNRVENWRDVSYNYPSGAIEKALYRGQEPKSLNTIDFTGPFEWTLENRYKAEAMLDVLRIKLRDRIREEMGGTYGVRIRGDFDRYPRQQYKITISFGANPERVEELTQEIFTQIDSLRNFGTTESNLQKVKEMHRREYETNLKENGYWMSALRLRYQNNLDPADIIRGDEKIDQLALSDIQEAARKYLNPENYVRVVLYPEDWAKE